jgi:putative nucleotidyltransferase with HDIG domain
VTIEFPPPPMPARGRGTGAPPPRDVVVALMEEAHRAELAARRELARQRYESALYLLRSPEEGATAATILRRVGRTYVDEGNIAAGMDCLVAALAVAEATQSLREVAHTINVMAISHMQAGSLDDAEPLFHEVARLAREAGDDRLAALVDQNLGIIASMHGEDEAALLRHTRSVDGFRRLNLQEELARQLSNVGLAHTKLGNVPEAMTAFNEALQIARAVGDTWTRLMVEVNNVTLMIAQKDFLVARVLNDRLLAEAQALRETRLLAEAHHHQGVIARETGRLEEADVALGMAYEEATARQDLLLAAETAREQAELHLSRGKNRETLKALGLSHRLFTQLHARRDLADVARRLRDLEHRFEHLVRHYAQNIESKDAYTLGHCERVADLACAVAVDYGFDPTAMFWFRVGALLHDVGKIVVPSDILNKAGPLAPEERAIMERHPVAGVELLNEVEFPWDVLPMIRGHHERWDGHGYPDRLAGEAIPLSARILCVADVFDALTSDRPYRRAYDTRDALRLMQADSARAFDPDILSRFFRVIMPADPKKKTRASAAASTPAFPSLADST